MMDVSLRGGLEGQRSNLPAREGIAHLHLQQVQVSPHLPSRKDTGTVWRAVPVKYARNDIMRIADNHLLDRPQF